MKKTTKKLPRDDEPKGRFEWHLSWGMGAHGQQLSLYDTLYDKQGKAKGYLYGKPTKAPPVARIWQLPNGKWSGTESETSFFLEDLIEYETQEEAQVATIAMYLMKDRKEPR